jgi:hypothetical protein
MFEICWYPFVGDGAKLECCPKKLVGGLKSHQKAKCRVWERGILPCLPPQLKQITFLEPSSRFITRNFQTLTKTVIGVVHGSEC